MMPVSDDDDGEEEEGKGMGERGARSAWEEPAPCIGLANDQAHLYGWAMSGSG